MQDMVASLAHRILKPLPSYTVLSNNSNGAVKHLERLRFQDGEVPLGVYENILGELTDAILVTNLGLHLQEDVGWSFIGYDQIERVDTPVDKRSADGLAVHLSTHDIVWVPVRGGRGKFRDAFEFLRFLQRIRSLYRIPSSAALATHP